MANKTPEDKFFELAKVDGPIAESTIAEVYDQLSPADPEKLIGKWKGSSFDTGHPSHKQLKDFKWAGKDFRSVDDVDPIMVYQEDGSRKWLQKFGNARLREVKFRGKVSAAMVYDNLPIIDSFRRVDDKTVVGAMDNKMLPKETGTYYFYLSKL